MLLWLMACRSEADCAAGFTLGDDGLCYQDAVAADDTGGEDTDVPEEEPPTVEDVMDALPACEPGAGDGRLDLPSGCAEGVCAGMTYREMVNVLGEPDYTTAYYYEYGAYTGGSIQVDWDNGLGTSFADDDHDGVPDATDTAFAVYVGPSYDGTTDGGLGAGVSMRCFFDGLGYPDEVTFTIVEKDWLISSAYWDAGGVSLSDYTDARGNSYYPDGVIDSISLYGSTGGL